MKDMQERVRARMTSVFLETVWRKQSVEIMGWFLIY
jgi:hypothetical protein